MKAHFVTGASGFLGRHLVQALLLRGDRVIILLREGKDGIGASEKLRKIFPDAPERLTCRVGDITEKDLGLSEKDCKEIAALHPELWHLAADLSFDTRDQAGIFRTNVEGTKNVVRFANEHAVRFWHMSTAYVQGKPHGVIKEDGLTPSPIFRNHYEETKYKAEDVVRNEAKIPFLVLRPSIVLGDAYREKALGCAFGYYRYLHIIHRFRAWIVRILRAGRVGCLLFRLLGTREYTEVATNETTLSIPWLFLPEPHHGKVNVVPVSYVVNAVLSLLERNHAPGTTLHLVHDNPPTYKFLLDVLLSDLRIRGVHHLPVPIKVFTAGFRFLHALVPPVRVYSRSALWYVPYIDDVYSFETTQSRRAGIPPPPKITKEYMSRVNISAIETIGGG